MTITAATGSGSKIDMVITIENAYGAVFRNWLTLVELAWLPLVIVFITQLAAVAVAQSGLGAWIAGDLVRAFGFLIFGTIFLARWHRFVLLGEAHSHVLFTAAWREF